MTHYLCHLESGRDFVLTDDDDMEAAFEAVEEAKWFDDYLVDLEPIDDETYTPYPND